MAALLASVQVVSVTQRYGGLLCRVSLPLVLLEGQVLVVTVVCASLTEVLLPVMFSLMPPFAPVFEFSVGLLVPSVLATSMVSSIP